MFSNGKLAINVKTVGEAISELSHLPKDMEISQGMFPGRGADIVIFNRDRQVMFAGGGHYRDTYENDAA